jgi:hypothetical protein
MPECRFPIRKVVATPLWLAGTLSMAGCLFHKPPRAYVPPPIYAPPAKSAPLLDLEPRVVMASLEVPSISLGDLSLPPWKPAPAPPKVTPPKRPAVAQTPPPAPSPPDTTPAAPAPPKITPLYSPQQTQESTKQLEEILGRVEQILANAGKKNNLNPEQLQQMETIKTYRQQAQEMRERDLMTAVELAKRAEVFANDLQKKLQ